MGFFYSWLLGTEHSASKTDRQVFYGADIRVFSFGDAALSVDIPGLLNDSKADTAVELITPVGNHAKES